MLAENGNGSEASSSRSKGENSQPKKPSASSHEQGEMAALQLLMDTQTHERNHHRMEAAGNAMLKERFPDMEKPGGDDMIQWHSPTTTNVYQAPSANQAEKKEPAKGLSTLGKAATAAALLAGGAGAGYLASQYGTDKPDPHTVDTDPNTKYGIVIYQPTG